MQISGCQREGYSGAIRSGVAAVASITSARRAITARVRVAVTCQAYGVFSAVTSSRLVRVSRTSRTVDASRSAVVARRACAPARRGAAIGKGIASGTRSIASSLLEARGTHARCAAPRHRQHLAGGIAGPSRSHNRSRDGAIGHSHCCQSTRATRATDQAHAREDPVGRKAGRVRGDHIEDGRRVQRASTVLICSDRERRVRAALIRRGVRSVAAVARVTRACSGRGTVSGVRVASGTAHLRSTSASGASDAKVARSTYCACTNRRRCSARRRVPSGACASAHSGLVAVGVSSAAVLTQWARCTVRRSSGSVVARRAGSCRASTTAVHIIETGGACCYRATGSCLVFSARASERLICPSACFAAKTIR